MWVATIELPSTASHPLYARLNQLFAWWGCAPPSNECEPKRMTLLVAASALAQGDHAMRAKRVENCLNRIEFPARNAAQLEPLTSLRAD
jgi:hypothetical protein